VRLSVSKSVLARFYLPLTPGSNHFKTRVERHDSQLKAHLVVALTGASVRYSVCAFLLCDLDQVLGDQRAGDRSTEHILTLIDCPGTQQGEEMVFGELIL
jgi:hypothetical protein